MPSGVGVSVAVADSVMLGGIVCVDSGAGVSVAAVVGEGGGIVGTVGDAGIRVGKGVGDAGTGVGEGGSVGRNVTGTDVGGGRVFFGVTG